jgi:hypothetical protein
MLGFLQPAVQAAFDAAIDLAEQQRQRATATTQGGC